jgi:glucose-1-phosphate thymidylyltransferase
LRAVVLAGGFAKRMWPLTLETPKQLLPLGGGYVILDLVFDKLLSVELDEIVLSTNAKFASKFEEWAKSRGISVRVEVEPARSEEEKPGAAAALSMLLEKLVRDDYLVIAGDNVTSLDFQAFTEFFRSVASPVVAVYDVGNLDLAKRYGVVELDDSGKIVSMAEKPERPASTLVATAIYAMPWRSLSRLPEYIAGGGNRDAIGHFVSWLVKVEDVYGYRFKGYWHDIGGLDEYERVKRLFSEGAIEKPSRVNPV